MKKLIIFILPVLIFLAGFAAFFGLRQTRLDIAADIAQFFALATAGKAEAVHFLDVQMENQSELLEALQVAGLWELAEIEEIRFNSLSRATVPLQLSVKNKQHTVNAGLIRRKGRWLIQSLPQITAIELAFISKSTENQITLFDLKNNRQLTLAAAEIQQPGSLGFAAGIDGRLVHFDPLHSIQAGKLLSLSDTVLESETTGLHTLTADTLFFQKQNETYKTVSRNEAVIGMQNLILYGDEANIRAVLLPDDYRPERIRVLLNTNGFRGVSHREVRLTATSSFSLEDKIAASRDVFAANQALTIKPENNGISVKLPSGESRFYANRIYISPLGSGKLKVLSLLRGSPEFVPAYRGHIEIFCHNGSLLLVNEVPLEAYLYSVVPSEMPVGFGSVPLQVQAVAARSYAVSAIYNTGLRSLGAHVDDSVSSQVYNNVPENEVSTAAVEATKGIVVMYNGRIADTRFFSTSAGVTANADEVWHDQLTGSFPGEPVPYLVSRPQLQSGKLPALSTEAGAWEFFTSPDWNSYDRLSPWFRWETEMTRLELEAVLRRYLPERHKMQPEFILSGEGEPLESMEDDPVGELVDLRVIRRGEGGNLMEIEIAGTKGTYRIIKEYNIRFTLRPVSVDGTSDIILKRHDGSVLKNYAILPSAFVVFDLRHGSDGKIESVLFRGGGNGHGAGLSQWGTRGLAGAGYGFREILEHYYPGCTIEKVY
ncbi:MAG TPA: SpoIID/LytB domain-containing protein [Firmicutes bacterium]|nr:SpoIID/LytB domain-containing protein [Bacillota bacterium]